MADWEKLQQGIVNTYYYKKHSKVFKKAFEWLIKKSKGKSFFFPDLVNRCGNREVALYIEDYLLKINPPVIKQEGDEYVFVKNKRTNKVPYIFMGRVLGKVEGTDGNLEFIILRGFKPHRDFRMPSLSAPFLGATIDPVNGLIKFHDAAGLVVGCGDLYDAMCILPKTKETK